MTNEYNFKEGDRVRLKGDDAFVGTIVDVGLYSADIVWDCEPREIYLQAFDCIEHADRRTAFLTRLQSLLREFDASIGYFIGDDEEYGWCDYPFLKIGNEIIKYPAGDIDDITADNIMKFDKP